MKEFLAMGGYGDYVWSAYGIACVLLLVGVILPLRQHKKILAELKRKKQREQR